MTILFCRAYYRFLSHGKYSWLVDAWLKKHLRNVVGGAATVLFLQRFIPNLYWNFKLGIFRFTACAGTFFCSERFVYKKQTSSISHESQRETQTLLEHCLQQYLRTRMAQKFAFIVLFTLAIFGGFARAAPCSRFPRTARQAPSIPASCETQLLPAQLQALKQQVRSKLVSIRDEMEEVVNGTLKGTTVSVARSTANFFHCQVAELHCILVPSFRLCRVPLLELEYTLAISQPLMPIDKMWVISCNKSVEGCTRLASLNCYVVH